MASVVKNSQGLGLLLRTGPAKRPDRLKGAVRIGHRSIDVRCVIRGATLLASGPQMASPAGCPLVKLAFSATDPWADGGKPAIAIADATVTSAPVGAVMWDELALEDDTYADDAECWVRIFGVHPYVKLDGSGTNIAVSDRLTHGASGKCVALTAGTFPIGVALQAVTTDSYGKVFLTDPLNLRGLI